MRAVLDEIVHHRRISQRRGVAQVVQLVGRDLAQDAAHDLAGTGLGQARGPVDHVGRGDRADLLAHVGDERCPIVDTWWQTETGGHLITPLPGATALKPGSATNPFFGVVPALVDAATGNLIEGEGEGALVITRPWPAQMRTVYGDHQRYIDTYFKQYPGNYFTGDGARRDKDGYYWITGRIDDVLNVSGHRLGTAEIESALVLHPHVAEAAVVGYPHDLKGQGIYAYVTPMAGVEGTDALKKELVTLVRGEIGPIAIVDVIQWAPSLPKTRSGKIMRRILRKIAANEIDTLGDTSTLADPTVVNDLIENRVNQ